MHPVLLSDFNELLLAVDPLSNRFTNAVELIHLTLLESKSVRTQSRARIGEKLFPELGMFDRATHDRTNHFISHVKTLQCSEVQCANQLVAISF